MLGVVGAQVLDELDRIGRNQRHADVIFHVTSRVDTRPDRIGAMNKWISLLDRFCPKVPRISVITHLDSCCTANMGLTLSEFHSKAHFVDAISVSCMSNAYVSYIYIYICTYIILYTCSCTKYIYKYIYIYMFTHNIYNDFRLTYTIHNTSMYTRHHRGIVQLFEKAYELVQPRTKLRRIKAPKPVTPGRNPLPYRSSLQSPIAREFLIADASASSSTSSSNSSAMDGGDGANQNGYISTTPTRTPSKGTLTTPTSSSSTSSTSSSVAAAASGGGRPSSLGRFATTSTPVVGGRSTTRGGGGNTININGNNNNKTRRTLTGVMSPKKKDDEKCSLQ